MSGLSQRIGGKTITGYGLAFRSIEPQITVTLKGKGISPVLLSEEPEFRPNIFKATLRVDATRLLAGCTSNQKEVEKKVSGLFGNTNVPSQVEIEWEGKDSSQDSKIYDLNGTLYLDLATKEQKNLKFIKQVLKFAFTMAGFGKSWRRIWHQDFYQKTYDKLIGCHWQSDGDWIDDIKTLKELKEFLNKLETLCCKYLPGTLSQPLNKP